MSLLLVTSHLEIKVSNNHLLNQLPLNECIYNINPCNWRNNSVLFKLSKLTLILSKFGKGGKLEIKTHQSLPYIAKIVDQFEIRHFLLFYKILISRRSVLLIGSTLAFGCMGPWFTSLKGRKKFLFHFWAMISWLPFTIELIHDYAKWLGHELIHHVWLSIKIE